MDVDVALNELGMLSAVTDSRRDYQGELQSRDNDASSSFHVVSANPKFVVNIGAVQKTYPSKRRPQKMKVCGTVDSPGMAVAAKLDDSAAERRTFKASSRVHHRYFFRPYSKNRRKKGVCLVKDIRNRSLEGSFQIQLPPPSESTLTQAMASMNIEKEKEKQMAASSSSSSLANLPLPDVTVRKGLRAHAR
ncbi:hypothetical protein BSL78_04951 [Apostichopus japonicus]|uniref:Uncharacterized protein n=1 Tax=Stichopus japonicus TaxID=307972 RepID=A0A2G8LD23_STIJA|nr:hypothetical protein BSL78_04951 [Apostichopus japonicus]